MDRFILRDLEIIRNALEFTGRLRNGTQPPKGTKRNQKEPKNHLEAIALHRQNVMQWLMNKSAERR